MKQPLIYTFRCEKDLEWKGTIISFDPSLTRVKGKAFTDLWNYKRTVIFFNKLYLNKVLLSKGE